jgi:hypothetical protein
LAHDLWGAGVRRDLWLYLLASAVLLLPVDVAVRRLIFGRRELKHLWVWVAALFSGRRKSDQTPSPVGRLFQAKARTETRHAGEYQPITQVPTFPSAQQGPSPTHIEGSAPAAPSTTPSTTPASETTEPALGKGETLAGRLLKKKRGQEEES